MRIIRHLVAAVLLVLGVGIALFSVPIAFGCGRRTLSLIATLTAAIGYAVRFGGLLLSDPDWRALASFCAKSILLLGSALLVPAIAWLVIRNENFPYGFLFATGCFSVVAYFWFRRYDES